MSYMHVRYSDCRCLRVDAVLVEGMRRLGRVKSFDHPSTTTGALVVKPWEANLCMFLGHPLGFCRHGRTGGVVFCKAYTTMRDMA